MDYPVALISQLKQHLRSLRKASGLTQADLAKRLGVGQSRVADIEANPGAVSVEQLLQVLTMLNAQMVVRDLQSHRDAIAVVTGVQVTAKTGAVAASIDSPPTERPQADDLRRPPPEGVRQGRGGPSLSCDDKTDPPQGQW